MITILAPVNCPKHTYRDVIDYYRSIRLSETGIVFLVIYNDGPPEDFVIGWIRDLKYH
jgi:hypothetical protein